MTSFFFHKEGGRITNMMVVEMAFDGLADGDYHAIIERKRKRSLQQNAYYWAVVVKTIKDRLTELGNNFTSEDVHDFLKDRFNSMPVIGDGGELLGNVGKSTANMTKDDFAIYLEKIMNWASEFLNINIPAPGQQIQFF